jgi:uncharacterized membrane protein YvbJ
MKHCNSCNLDYDDNFNFCRKCGAPLQNVSSGDNLTYNGIINSDIF